VGDLTLLLQRKESGDKSQEPR